MSIEELKLKVITKLINTESEEALLEIDSLLGDTKVKSSNINLSNQYDRIKKQYGTVLNELAK
jgi:hypothetical protein